ncbi:hypothetical protein JKP88DRAFT_243892 [Tribonema minus]|uniref:Uncharacterized protein n=1 Tax=Tribonema minus TaxID=303371 RepID=A0A835Z7F3_9STRA|nr:hypothetical protein JKP88DRAFT_243892 [Tribonema minus]
MAQRRALTPFELPGLHDTVLCFAGRGQGVFLACVSKSWAAAIRRQPGVRTTYDQIARYPKRVAWAWRVHHCSQLAWAIGKWSPPDIVTRFMTRCAAVHHGVCRLKGGIISSNRPRLLECLQKKTGVHINYEVTLHRAIDVGSYNVARWCKKKAGPGYAWHSEIEALERSSVKAWAWHAKHICPYYFDWLHALITAIEVGGVDLARKVLDRLPAHEDADSLGDKALPFMCTGSTTYIAEFFQLSIGLYEEAAMTKAVSWMRGKDADHMRGMPSALLSINQSCANGLQSFCNALSMQ